MDGGAWWAAVHGVAKSRTRLSNFPFTFHFHALEKEMTTHSSILAWRIPGTGEPGGLPSVGSHRVGHDWSDLAAPLLSLSKTLSSHYSLPSVPLTLTPLVPGSLASRSQDCSSIPAHPLRSPRGRSHQVPGNQKSSALGFGMPRQCSASLTLCGLGDAVLYLLHSWKVRNTLSSQGNLAFAKDHSLWES